MLEKILVTDEILLSAKIIEDSYGWEDIENEWGDIENGREDIENLFQLRSSENNDNCDPEKFEIREAKIKRLFEIFIDAIEEVKYDNYDFDDFNLYLGKFYESEGNLSKALNLYDICIKNDQRGQICFLWGKVRVLLQLGKTEDAFTIIQNKLYYLLDNWNMDHDRKVKSLINHLA
ncbi:MAG: hypothetical protein K8S13_00635 [Desulfobacula sp.]|uniref:hypothetical protein n=1 Tax=Desulfobacula sp. TaxID=2593537 RepID=UPI0025C6AEF0|nr:hypothetical protein [Desulfobacula sp.]MCD4718354.1 hypothetical protein [Desulfobacula sp.]